MEKIVLAKHFSQDNSELSLEVAMLYSEGLYKLEEYKKALKAISELLEIGELDDEKRSELLQKKGRILTRMSAFSEALIIFEELANMEPEKCKVLGFGNLAWVYLLMYRQGNKDEYLEGYLEKAKESCDKALAIFDTYNNPELHKKVLINMGNIYWNYEKYNEALKLFFRAYDEDNPNVLNNIASTYVSLGNSCEAEKYLHKAEMKALSQNNYHEEAHCYTIHARISEIFMEDYAEAKNKLLVAFHKLLDSEAINEACTCLDRIRDLDSLINKENINLLKEKIKSKLGGDVF